MKGDGKLSLHSEDLGGGYVVFTDGLNTFSADSLLLAHFAPVRSPAADLCTGCGAVALLLCRRGCRGTGYEIDPEAAALARRGAAASGADLCITVADVRDLPPETDGKFSLVTCNPPYFKEGRSPSRRRNEIRSEILLSPDALFTAAERLLSPDGVFCFCHREERREELTGRLAAHGLYPRRVELVRSQADNPPYLFLMEAGRKQVSYEAKEVLLADIERSFYHGNR